MSSLDKHILKWCRWESLKSFLILLVFLIGFFAAFYPAFSHLNSHFLGSRDPDLYDEIWLDQAAVRGALEGNPFVTDSTNFPEKENLLLGYISYAHVFITSLLTLTVPWPLWLNLSVVLSGVIAAYSFYWAVFRLTNQRMLAVFTGLLFLFSPCLEINVYVGYLCQTWAIGPMNAAFVFLYETIYCAEKKNAWIWLSFWTVIGSLIFLLTSLFLFFAALIMLVLAIGKIKYGQLKNSLFAFGTAFLILLPYLILVAQAQPMVREFLSGTDTSSEYRSVLQRSREASLILGNQKEKVTLPQAHFDDMTLTEMLPNNDKSSTPEGIYAAPGALRKEGGVQGAPELFRGQVPTFNLSLAFLIPIALSSVVLCLALVEYKYSKGFALFLLVSFVFFVLALGPNINYLGSLAADSRGVLLEMPFLWLIRLFPVLYRWSFPARLIPAIMLCLSLGLGFLLSYLSSKISKYSFAMVTLVFILILSQAFTMLRFRFTGDFPSILVPAYTPKFALFLSSQPFGAVVDMPLGYVGNTRINYALHHHQVIQARQRPIPTVMGNSPLLLDLFSWNQKALNSLDNLSYPSNFGMMAGSDYMPYGMRFPTRESYGAGTLLPLNALELCKGDKKADCKRLLSMGIRYLVLHRANCYWIDPDKGGNIYAFLKQKLTLSFGKPVFSNYDSSVFLMDS